jgi:hypothetical protein
MQEIWKDIPQFEGKYQASSLGRIMSLNYLRTGKSKELKPRKNAKGYTKVILPGGKNFYVHQLVAMAFLGHTPNGNTLEVDHINENKSDNRLSNLRILTTRENVSVSSYATKNGLPVGVDFRKTRGKFRSSIQINGKQTSLGSFNTSEEAGQAYQNKLKELNLC